MRNPTKDRSQIKELSRILTFVIKKCGTSLSEGHEWVMHGGDMRGRGEASGIASASLLRS